MVLLARQIQMILQTGVGCRGRPLLSLKPRWCNRHLHVVCPCNQNQALLMPVHLEKAGQQLSLRPLRGLVGRLHIPHESNARNDCRREYSSCKRPVSGVFRISRPISGNTEPPLVFLQMTIRYACHSCIATRPFRFHGNLEIRQPQSKTLLCDKSRIP